MATCTVYEELHQKCGLGNIAQNLKKLWPSWISDGKHFWSAKKKVSYWVWPFTSFLIGRAVVYLHKWRWARSYYMSIIRWDKSPQWYVSNLLIIFWDKLGYLLKPGTKFKKIWDSPRDPGRVRTYVCMYMWMHCLCVCVCVCVCAWYMVCICVCVCVCCCFFVCVLLLFCVCVCVCMVYMYMVYMCLCMCDWYNYTLITRGY